MTEFDALTHITFQTGHSRRSLRSEVDARAIAQLAGAVEACEREGTVELPTPAGLMLLQRLAPTEPAQHSACWAIKRPDGTPLVTQALALEKSEGDALWAQLHAGLAAAEPKFTTEARKPPVEPWLGVALHLPLLLEASKGGGAIHCLGDLERCVAWAWIDRCYAPDGAIKPTSAR